jgi:hypothetical protein
MPAWHAFGAKRPLTKVPLPQQKIFSRGDATECLLVGITLRKGDEPLGGIFLAIFCDYRRRALRKKARAGTREMYGILAACIAIMALFLGLFAVSVQPSAQDDIALSVDQPAQVHTIASQAPTDKH